ncbi:MAG: methylmalonyl-CoA decarboxylase [Pseudomonadota bacterium]|jgi:methylmalonyl-CoA decarboxylase
MLESRLEGTVGIVTMNNDSRRNVISAAFISDLMQILNTFREKHVRAVILRANKGVKVWSAGHDVDELPPPGHDPLHWSEALPRLVRMVQTFPAPVVAMIEGTVWGGACEMAMACDIIIATQDTTFAITPAKIGVPYNINGLSTFSRAMNSHLLNELLFTAQPLDAQRLAASGAINYAVPKEELESFTQNLVARICENSPRAISVMKESLRGLMSRQDLPVSEFERLQELRHAVYNSDDYAEGLEAIRNKRKPNFAGN